MTTTGGAPSASGAMSPLVVEFEIAAAPERAFAAWTEQIATWWPTGHSITEDPADIRFEPHVGGRIVETDHDGNEHVWGTVTAWQPPHRVAFSWHLHFDPAEATDVSVSFEASPAGTTVRLVQVGWERLGGEGAVRRERTVHGWGVVTTSYGSFVARGTRAIT